jgi:hypothetical protein
MLRRPPGGSRLLRTTFLVVVLLVLTLLLRAQGLEDASKWAGVGGLLVAIAGLVLPHIWPSDATPLKSPRGVATLDVLADKNLAVVWDAEWRRRRLHDPAPLPVSWENADEWGDQWQNVAGVDKPLSLEGQLDGLAAVWWRLPRRRLVVVGDGGMGKSVLCLHLARELLAARSPGGPIPIPLALSSWDPEALGLDDWLVRRLPIDVAPGLAGAAADGTDRTLAQAMVEDGLVIPLLDGLDQLTEPARARAIRRINEAGDRPLLLSCRTAEFEQALAGAHDVVSGAAVIRLRKLSAAQVGNWLRRTVAGPAAGKWGSLTEISGLPAEALSTPLLAGLAREVYSETSADPRELLGCTEPNDVEWHLLAAFVPAAFGDGAGPTNSRGWPLERVQHYLRTLGAMAASTEKIEWWRLSAALPTWRSRLAKAGVVAGVAAVSITGTFLAWKLPTSWPEPAAEWVVVFGLSVFALEPLARQTGPAALRIGLDRRRLRSAPRLIGRLLARSVLFGLLLGLLGGAITVAQHFHSMVHQVVSPLAGLRLGGIAVLLSAAVFTPGYIALTLALLLPLVVLTMAAAPIDVDRIVGPRPLLNLDRWWSLAQGLLAGLLASLAFINASSLLDLVSGRPLSDIPAPHLSWPALLSYGPPALAAYLLTATAWGRYRFALAWLALGRGLPWRFMAFLDIGARRGVLRQAGAGHTFRHERLRAYSADPDQRQH